MWSNTGEKVLLQSVFQFLQTKLDKHLFTDLKQEGSLSFCHYKYVTTITETFSLTCQSTVSFMLYQHYLHVCEV